MTAAIAVCYARTTPAADAEQLSKLTSFVAIGAGGFASAAAGCVADPLGKAETAIVAMALSGTSAVAVALTFSGLVWLTFLIVVIWGITIIPNSA